MRSSISTLLVLTHSATGCCADGNAAAGRRLPLQTPRVTALVRVSGGGRGSSDEGRGLYDVRLLVIADIEQLFDEYLLERVEVRYCVLSS